MWIKNIAETKRKNEGRAGQNSLGVNEEITIQTKHT